MPKKAPKELQTISTDAPVKAVKTKKAAAKKTAAKKPTAKKAAAKKPASKKPVEKAAGKSRAHKAAGSAVFLPEETYKAHIEGMMAQGLDRGDAVDTLRIGIREANGLRVSAQLLASIPQQAQAMAA